MNREILESEKRASEVAYRFVFETQCGSEPMIFGYQIGRRGNEDYTSALGILTPEQTDQFIRGYAHAVAMTDLDLGPRDPLANDLARDQLARLEEFAYQYFKGVQDYRNRKT